MSEVVGNISGLPEKMPGNSDHPPAFHSGRPENFAGISARRFNGVEHQGFSVVGERRTGVIATGVFREVPTVSENRANLSSTKIRAGANEERISMNVEIQELPCLSARRIQVIDDDQPQGKRSQIGDLHEVIHSRCQCSERALNRRARREASVFMHNIVQL
jgi:hypothetical protein